MYAEADALKEPPSLYDLDKFAAAIQNLPAKYRLLTLNEIMALAECTWILEDRALNEEDGFIDKTQLEEFMRSAWLKE